MENLWAWNDHHHGHDLVLSWHDTFNCGYDLNLTKIVHFIKGPLERPVGIVGAMHEIADAMSAWKPNINWNKDISFVQHMINPFILLLLLHFSNKAHFYLIISLQILFFVVVTFNHHTSIAHSCNWSIYFIFRTHSG